tara:strand:+ start:2052 stop:3200 length:1149 start_codon:yes stop_codon:yes gene_type:complete
MQRNVGEKQCATIGGILIKEEKNRRTTVKCKRTCTPDTPPTQPERVKVPPLHFKPAATDATDQDASLFAGRQTDEERSAALRGCAGGGELSCGFLAPNSFEAAVAVAPPHEHCKVVVLTAILGGSDTLRQPRAELGDSRGCLFAFVDGALAKRRSARDGAWTLLPLQGELPFGANARRNSRVPKLLPHRLFPTAEFALWIDGKLQLNMPPLTAVRRFLTEPEADFAALRNLRRDSIDQEHSWIVDLLCSRQDKEACDAVNAQWQLYLQGGASHGVGMAPGWQRRAPVIEGAFFVADLRAAATQCLLCSWFNEYVRYSERDQLSFAYVYASLGGAARVHLIPRKLHWSVAKSQDTVACYNATERDAQTIATHFAHTLSHRQSG